MSLVIGMNSVSSAQEKDSLKNIEPVETWGRFTVNLGGFIAGVNTGVRFGNEQLGLGIDIKLEEALGMQASNFVFRSDAMYRFGEKKKHSIKAGYFSFTRSAEKILDTELEVGDHVFPIGTDITSRFDFAIFNAMYDYAFFNDKRVNLGVSLGFFIMPTRFEIGVSGVKDESTEFVAPLPVLGLRTDFVITPKFYLKQSIEVLYLRIDNFTGSILDVNLRLEYNTWKHIGFGMGINMYKLAIEGKAESYPGIDMVGSIEIGYTGLQLYGRCYF